MEQHEFESFFKPYSESVDSANTLAFWKLSDDIITEIIKKHIPPPLGAAETILDAGGGTGRWICDLSKIYDSKFVLYDLSTDMLGVAKQNTANASIEDRVTIVQGDLTDMSALESDSIDYAVSIYSPISFVADKEKAANELHRVLKKGGRLIIMGHGYYNALASKINNYQAPPEELENMDRNSVVKWGDHVPSLNIFSQEGMEALLSNAGFTIIQTHGVPVFVQPQVEDWDPKNTSHSRITRALENKTFYDEVLALEMKYNGDPNIANRGMNIFTVVEK